MVALFTAALFHLGSAFFRPVDSWRGRGETREERRGSKRDWDGSPDDAVRALTKLLGDCVALIDDEVLVEDLEDLPALEVAHGC